MHSYPQELNVLVHKELDDVEAMLHELELGKLKAVKPNQLHVIFQSWHASHWFGKDMNETIPLYWQTVALLPWFPDF